jgi:hypothetical protein
MSRENGAQSRRLWTETGKTLAVVDQKLYNITIA